jgi:hypothetical protein
MEHDMTENIRLSAQGIPHWFSPQHAGEKFREIAEQLAMLAADAEKAKKRSLARKLRDLHKYADDYARDYLSKSPVQSVRVMQPSGAIFVILADGREVVVPQ